MENADAYGTSTEAFKKHDHNSHGFHAKTQVCEAITQLTKKFLIRSYIYIIYVLILCLPGLNTNYQNCSLGN